MISFHLGWHWSKWVVGFQFNRETAKTVDYFDFIFHILPFSFGVTFNAAVR